MTQKAAPSFKKASAVIDYGVDEDPRTHTAQNMNMESKRFYSSVIHKMAEGLYGVDDGVQYIVGSDDEDPDLFMLRIQSSDENISVGKRIATAHKISHMMDDMKLAAKAAGIPLKMETGSCFLYVEIGADINHLSALLKKMPSTPETGADIRNRISFAEAIHQRSEKYIPKYQLN